MKKFLVSSTKHGYGPHDLLLLLELGKWRKPIEEPRRPSKPDFKCAKIKMSTNNVGVALWNSLVKKVQRERAECFYKHHQNITI